MNSTRRTRIPADIAAQAPSVDPAWVEAFVVEQRLLDVPGDRIGDALAVVESHVRDSGESAQEAFGEPVAYARSVATPGSSRPLGGRFVAAMVLGVVGMLAANSAFASWLAHERVTLTAGGLVTLLLLGLALATLLVAPGTTLRAVIGRWWMAALLPVVLVGLSVASLLLLPQVLVSLPATAVGVAGALTVLASTLLLLTDRDVEGPVRAPGQPVTDKAGARWFVALILPAMSLVMLGLTALLHSLA